MAQASERTRLLPEVNQPEYVFNTSIRRERKQRLKQFQCCLCALFLSLLLIALVVTVSFSINNSDEPSPTADATNDSEIPVLVLLTNTWPIPDKKYKNESVKDKKMWEGCIQVGRKALQGKDEMEKEVPSLPVRSPSYRHQKIVATSEKARNLTRIGHVMEYTTKCLHRNKQNKAAVNIICQNDNVSLTDFSEFCKRSVQCNIFQKYRTYDGTCNNLNQPGFYGVSYRPFRRALPPDYADGISKPRESKDGKPLPSARTVSHTVHRSYYKDDPKFSIMLAIWGQFLDHDITATALSQKSNGDTISCCDSTTVTFPECFPVHLDRLDPGREYNVTCMEFVRSSPAPTCCLGPREQLNQVTAFIDGSVVYGADEKLTNTLRNLQNGTLKMFVTEDGRFLLPVSDDINDGCNRVEQEKKGEYCFLTGDARANENLHLTSMHLLWARQHNLLALNLSRFNPHWDDEIIFQEARRIVGAQMQHITYNEFLPILLGNKVMSEFNLSPQNKGYFKSYKDSIDPNIANNFATAAFRFAHSIIPGLMKLLANDTSSPEFVQMHKMLLDPFKLYMAGELDKTLRGAMNTTIEARDPYFTNELKTHLFERNAEQVKQPKLCGLDLVSLNIQRGRDHGLPGYSFWRKHCGLKKPNEFNDLKHDLDKESLRNIKTIYRHVDDIDLYTGALSEKPVEGSILGPTLTCLILDQFIRIKHGDRFWYENPQEPQAFTPEQLNEIRKTSLANIICDNSDNLSIIQPKVMQAVNSRNNYISCLKIPRPNLALWRERLGHLALTGDSINVIAMGNS